MAAIFVVYVFLVVYMNHVSLPHVFFVVHINHKRVHYVKLWFM